MSQELCDAEVIGQLVAGGDRDALDRIARCYFGYLMRVGRCACRDPDSAADAVQDALLSAAARLDQFRGDGSVKAWLSRMVVNACRCRERGRKNDPAWNRPLEEESIAGASDNAPALAELGELIGRAVDRLAPADRELFVLSQIDGVSAPELARVFGCSPDAVRARLTRIRRSLRADLEPVWRDWA